MIYYISLLFVLLFNTPLHSNPELDLEITGIKKDAGFIEVGIYNSEEYFLEEGKSFKTYKIPVKNKKASIRISDLPQGNYAITLYHDENEDGKCNMNFLGIPKEPYAFSNNFKPKFSAPSFEDCVFNLKENLSLDIKLIH
ncbi:DUF2141 domain-containing protein [Mesonia ostreae]|uniref:DUF2141 domain-containing protein n=1 Tax=Mesonia ostreae TaxID=861110 RepID=A0ABU2KGE4_9FLAO|nr:DUF2141 domain-containing protein [Mesonia ostreae]MDT0293739.1 DUF2141 domain-containing protein [Mesonia ostreae]